MDDIDPDKALAALEPLEAEKARRLQAKIDSGEVVEIETVVVIGRDENIEDAKARALARRPVPDDGRAFTTSSPALLRASHGATRIRRNHLRKYKQVPRKGPRTLLKSRLGAGPPSPAPSQPMCE
jgi:hypothetical protein